MSLTLALVAALLWGLAFLERTLDTTPDEPPENAQQVKDRVA